MKTLLTLTLLLCFGGLSQVAAAHDMDADATPTPVHLKKIGKTVYVCPMDGYTSDKPGTCPKCGMDLEKKVTKPSKTKTSSKAKDQDPEVAEKGIGKTARICPVSGDPIKSGHGEEAVLANGKKIMLCCPDCADDVEKSPQKYTKFMYD